MRSEQTGPHPVRSVLTAGVVIAAVLGALGMGRRFLDRPERGAIGPADGTPVCVDQGHNNYHRIDGTYRQLAARLAGEGNRVLPLAGKLGARQLSSCRVLLAPLPMGPAELGFVTSAYDERELDAVAAWVRGGGGFFLVTDRGRMGEAAERLLDRFGVRILPRTVVDPDRRAGAGTCPEAMLFTHASGSIAAGAGPPAVGRVMTFGGAALLPARGSGFLRLGPRAAASYAPGGAATPVAGWSQMVFVEHGRGRVAVVADGAMFAVQGSGPGRLCGLEHPGADNAALALATVRWLAESSGGAR